MTQRREDLEFLHHLEKTDLLDLVRRLKEKKGVSVRELKDLSSAHDKILLPLEIFAGDCSPLEAVVVYLKEHRWLPYHKIAVLLQRDDRTIWSTYDHVRRTKKRLPLDCARNASGIRIPLDLFRKRTLSIFEALVSYLRKRHGLHFREIADLLHRDQRTIWTIDYRSRQKGGRNR